MRVRILFFGRLKESARADELATDLPPAVRDTGELRAWLGREMPALLDASVRVAVNETIVPGNASIREGDEIAFLPPMSGG